MKKFIIAFVAVGTLLSTSAFAGGREKINPALTTFQKEFKGATDVKWNEGKDAITAAFVLNNSRVEAYFDYTGELLGTARNVVFNQLPLSVVKELSNRYESAPIYDIIEYTRGADTFYDMIVETPTKKLRVRATVAGDVSVLKKIK
jgi:hypothetical protein